jgi:hypothetical protein
MIKRWLVLGCLLASVAAAYAVTQNFTIAVTVGGTSCAFTTTLPDGCAGAQTNGTLVDAHLADPKAVIDLNIDGGSGYTNGTYAWTSTGGGCTTAASGNITVAGGILGGATRGTPANFAISNHGVGCTSRPTIAVPAGAGAGTGGLITPTVYQLTPHNAATTWSVAGVDYPVGYDTTLTLKDPTVTANLPACASFAGSAVTINASSCTLNGFDFGLHHTHLVVAGGLTGVLITNNKFACLRGTTTDLELILINGGSTNTTIKYNTFDGGSTLGVACVTGGQNAAIGTVATGGTINVQYNYCFNEDSKCLESNQSAASPTSYTLNEQYNYWVDFGICGGGCSHGEAEYAFSSTTQGANAVINWTMGFNVMLIHYYAGPGNATSAASIEADGTTINNPDIENNYELARGTQLYTGSNNNNGQVASGAMFCGAQESGNYTGTTVQKNNILEYSGGFFPYNAGGTVKTCAVAFPALADFNAGTGNTCNTTTCN